MTIYAINGLGRIGKLALRPMIERGDTIAFLNDAVGDPALHTQGLIENKFFSNWLFVFYVRR